jgi:hypothetical protein
MNQFRILIITLSIGFAFSACKKKEETSTLMEVVDPSANTLIRKGVLSDGDPSHKSSGNVEIYQASSGKILQFKNFQGSTQPDVRVYLSKAPTNVTESIEIGKVKATSGSFNYNLENSLDLNQYTYVVLWCKQYSVLFGKAPLSNP